MSLITDKITQFQAVQSTENKEHYASLASSQAPHTLLVTCSDSRLCPQEFTSTEAGELFVIRNAGNLMPAYSAEAPTNEGLTLEFGVCALGVKEIVVCGHSSCGAMAGLQDTSKLDALPLVQKGLETYKAAHKCEVDACDSLESLIDWNVHKQVESVMGYPFVQEKVAKGELKVSGIVYDFVKAEVLYSCEVQKNGEIAVL